MELQSKSEQKRQAAHTKASNMDEPVMVLTTEDMIAIGRLCHKNILDKPQLFQAILELTTITVDGVLITLEPKLLMRLRTRCLDKPNWSKWLAETIVRQLHDYAGW